jgi:hypothetical protein
VSTLITEQNKQVDNILSGDEDASDDDNFEVIYEKKKKKKKISLWMNRTNKPL